MPGTYGGTNWPGAALDPETGILYVPSHHAPIVTQLVPPPEGSRPLDQVTMLAPSLEDAERGVPEVREQWREIFGV